MEHCTEQVWHVVQVWEHYEPANETATTSGADEDLNGHACSDSPRETVSVTVTEVVSGSHFYVQVCNARTLRNCDSPHMLLLPFAFPEAEVPQSIGKHMHWCWAVFSASEIKVALEQLLGTCAG